MTRSRNLTIGLSIAAVLGVLDILSAVGAGADDGPPVPALVIGVVLGIITLAGVSLAWRGRRGEVRSRCAWALVGLSAIAVVSAVSAPPAGAVAAPVASVAPHAPAASRHDVGGRSSPSATAGQAEPAHLSLSMVAILVGLGLAIGVPIAGRARIADEHSIRRFRAELRNADVSDRCLEAIRVDRDQAFGREPPSPGDTTGS